MGQLGEPGSVVSGDSGGSATPSPAPVGAGMNDAGGAGTGTPGSDAVALSPESYIRVPGQDRPVKYSDFINGYVSKADFTRAQQRIAAERDAAQKSAKDTEAKFANAARQVLARLGQGGQGNAQPAPNSLQAVLGQLEAQPYVDGPTAAGLFRNLIESNVLPLANAIKQRDQVLDLLYKRLQALDGNVSTLRNRTTNEEFMGRLAKVRGELALPEDPVVGEFLQDIYLSYEGEDLDQEFPRMAKERFDALRTLFREMDRREADEARNARVGIPGKGGAATPGKPLRRGFLSPAQIADELWPGGRSET